ncbi:uncharacterized protein LOC120266964 isoform X2 [Dioscorea cayenensis subsp. rotundata]|uniref:Uncharacterized protein LOC120266964 isoform X2 n=1 Tax=Dioscorea cayennensis subsp. rotundata TaxID=55577 RepID=A0AB40BT05_DIOCR|nr:uncharacterized protein LOC120266964 isoform X2 [Dioscorea cayenensis subsp. rotundata]
MSKKKNAGSTMTLKDFHGGSIPSDLPLPSAPGVSVRPAERNGGWGGAVRPEYHRQRPGSAGGVGAAAVARGIDDRGPFISHPSHIGRHFDEDERKPFEANAVPRRPAADAVSLRSEQIRPVSHFHQSVPVSHPSQNAIAPHIPSSGSAMNAWGLKKETGVDQTVGIHSTAAVAASRFAQASAIEKISSGRWQSKPPDVEVIQVQETDALERRFGESVRVADVGEKDKEKEKEKEMNTMVEFGAREHEKARSLAFAEISGPNSGGSRPRSNEGRFGVPQGLQEVPERPKLKLLPRTKPMEPSEARVLEDKQSYQPAVEAGHTANAYGIHGSMNQPKPGSAGSDGGSQPVERPRLNLKPRSQPLEQSAESIEWDRKSVFGGARPRELVLKERGIDTVAVDNQDLLPVSNRPKQDSPKSGLKLESATPTSRVAEKADTLHHDARSGKSLERKDYRANIDKAEVHRNSLKNDNWRNTKETEKPREQPRQEPETWRKPVEEPKPEVPGQRFGKVASALELAQAFSRSVSDAKLDNRIGNQRSQPGRTQVPFSRLTDAREFYSGQAKRQINGY